MAQATDPRILTREEVRAIARRAQNAPASLTEREIRALALFVMVNTVN